jgi:lipopolysaccharide cholinephosphotransferase
MSLTEELLNLMAKNNIVGWLEDGSLLGAIRHKNIIPWDYDCDLCMLKPEFLKIK